MLGQRVRDCCWLNSRTDNSSNIWLGIDCLLFINICNDVFTVKGLEVGWSMVLVGLDSRVAGARSQAIQTRGILHKIFQNTGIDTEQRGKQNKEHLKM